MFAALRSGASGFLLKDAAPSDLIAAARTVVDGSAMLAPTVTKRLIDVFSEQHSVDARLAGTSGGAHRS